MKTQAFDKRAKLAFLAVSLHWLWHTFCRHYIDDAGEFRAIFIGSSRSFQTISNVGTTSYKEEFDRFSPIHR